LGALLEHGPLLRSLGHQRRRLLTVEVVHEGGRLVKALRRLGLLGVFEADAMNKVFFLNSLFLQLSLQALLSKSDLLAKVF
jgi:hypothetical protein